MSIYTVSTYLHPCCRYDPTVGFMYQLVPGLETLELGGEGEAGWRRDGRRLVSPRTVMSSVTLTRDNCL